MCEMQPRFDVIIDIVDRWMVWDRVADCPASFGGEILIGLSLSSATQLAEILNSIYRNCLPQLRRTMHGFW
jgi:hypothetical protein